MRRPRAASFQRANSSPRNSPPLSWLEPPGLGVSPRGSGDSTHRGRGITTPLVSLPSSPSGGSSSVGGGGSAGWADSAQSLLFQVVFWPLTLCLMLVGSGYRLLLRVGCSRTPLRFHDPPGWVVRAMATPFRLVNPPVSLGMENLEACLGVQGVGRISSSPVMLVGNHNLLGLDCVLVLDEVGGVEAGLGGRGERVR